MACHIEGCLKNDVPMYEFWHDFRVKSKFWGKSIEFTPYGNCYLKLTKTNEVFTWKKVTSSIHNVIGGTPWAEHYGELKIVNHTTNETCLLNFRQEKGLFSQSSDNEVSGFIFDANGNESYAIKGTWNARLFVFGPPVNSVASKNHTASVSSLKSQLDRSSSKGNQQLKAFSQLIWQHKGMPDNHKLHYGFNDFAISLNEILPHFESFLPPTDTRLRPDQRNYELGNVDLADLEKARLEELQRERRKTMDTEESKWKPVWFEKAINPYTKEESWEFNKKYWDCRRSRSFEAIKFSLW